MARKNSDDAVAVVEVPEIVRKEFKDVVDVSTPQKMIDVRAIHSNVEQSRGNGVLSGMLSIGWKAFPGDDAPTKPKEKDVKLKGDQKLKDIVPADENLSVLGELVSDDPVRQSRMLNLLSQFESDEQPKSIWEMVNSMDQRGQLQPIRVRPVYDENMNPVEGQWNTIYGARRTLTRAFQYGLSCVGQNFEDETYRPLNDGEESHYKGLLLHKLDGKPLLLAEVVEGKDVKEQLFAALEENRARKDQSPIDEAKFMRKLKTDYGMKIKEIAKAVYGEDAIKHNKDQMVTKRLQLLQLLPEEQMRVHTGALGVGKAEKLVRDRAENKVKPGETAKNKPGQGERMKMPSVAQALELYNATDASELSEDVKVRFGKPKLFALITEDVRKYFAAFCGVEKYQTLAELTEQKAKEAAAAQAEETASEEPAKKKGKKKEKAEAAA